MNFRVNLNISALHLKDAAAVNNVARSMVKMGEREEKDANY
jgi:hypothetical protein